MQKPKNEKIPRAPKARPNKPGRLDSHLVEFGHASALSEAQALIMAGKVLVNDQRIDKPSVMVKADDRVRVKQAGNFVSRGGDKLSGALASLNLAPSIKGARILDVGASTGGFTHCCLELGASEVFAVDVGTNQLAWELRTDPRVKVFENTDLRNFKSEFVGTIDGVVADLSFTSLARLAPEFARVSVGAKWLLLLVKPQFELERSEVPAGGIVTDEASHRLAVSRVRTTFEKLGFKYIDGCEAPITGRSGNQEFFVLLQGIPL